MMSELDDFDWMNHKGPDPSVRIIKPIPPSIIGANAETPYERRMRMLVQLSQTCLACSMCELGLKIAYKGNLGRDPHLLSNLNPKRFMIVDQNPGWAELEKHEPFINFGDMFNSEIGLYGLTRNDFYICNMVRCFSDTRPTAQHIEQCSPFFQIEINIIKPRLVIALGAAVFEQLCPGVTFLDSLKKITKSNKFNINVFAIYHPSMLNLQDANQVASFKDQIKVMCALVKAMIKRNSD